jgi:hypothetical protein
MADGAYLEALTKRLADEGKLIEAGWVGLRLFVGLENAPAAQLDEMRLAFMAGAQHLFASMVNMLDPDTDVTEAELMRMELIHRELETFRKEIELRAAPPQGSA